jgi:hypothetical protein
VDKDLRLRADDNFNPLGVAQRWSRANVSSATIASSATQIAAPS